MNSTRAITKTDVSNGETFYVTHVDLDANVIRHHGPFGLHRACEVAANFEAMGQKHTATVVDTPEPVKRSLAKL